MASAISQINEGDRVQVITRDVTAEDTKSSLYYGHFAGLTGVVSKVFATQDASIEVEQASLPEGVSKRHHDFQDSWRSRWLDGLSEEARNRLSPQEREFNIRYTILVSLNDLVAAPADDASAPRATDADLTAAELAELERRRRS